MNLSHLSPLLHRPGPWASVYVPTGRAAADAGHRHELQARGVGDTLAEQGADRATRRAVHDALTVPARDRPGTALFAAGGEVVVDAPLHTPPAPEATWSDLPHLAPLPGLGGGDPVCLVAYVDRTGADLEIRAEGGTRPAGGVAGRDWPVHRTGRDDWSERHRQLAVENTWEENAARAADATAARAEQCRADVVVLTGDPRARRAVHDRLPEQVRALTVETGHGGRAAGAATRLLDEDIDAARTDVVRAERESALERFRAGRVPTGGRIEAVEGLPHLVEAARQHRIATLLVRPEGADVRRPVWTGREPDVLALRRTDVRQLGEPHPAAADAADALLRAAVATGADVVPLPPAATDGPGDVPVGGLGALLRWAHEGGLPDGGTPPAG